MISAPTWINANSALQYHTEQKDNYYQQEGDLGQWQGKGAQALGFAGVITKEDLEKALFGKDKEGNQALKVRVDKESGDRVRAGLDLTFSAPKSVSILYEAAQAYSDNDTAKAIKNAHERAVAKVIERLEDRYSQTRLTEDGITKRVDTGNLVIAKFTHEVARPVSDGDKVTVDPSLHTHAVIMNMTQTKEGEYKAIESKAIFENYIKLGMNYRTELAAELKELGYEIKITDAKKGFFELKNIDDSLIEEFSKRSEQLDKLVNELKTQYPNKSESEIKQMAAWKSREWKGEIDRKAILEDNRQRIESLGYSKEILEPKELKELTKEQMQEIKEQQKEAANKAVKNAIEALSSQESVFKSEQVIEAAGKFALKDQLSLETLEKALQKSKEIVKLTDNYFTTKDIIKAEKSIIKAIKDKKHKIKSPFETKKEAKEAIQRYSDLKEEKTGYGLTKGQKEAAAQILSNKDLIIGIQGDAGVGKTTMLKAVNELSSDNTKLIGLSYTGKAASEIQKATISKESFNQAGIKSQTIARFLSQIHKLDYAELSEFKNSKLIVDEASMLGTKDAQKLIDFAKKANAQIVLIGDVKQLKAINAGSPFELLQDNGMKTVAMTEVLRQKDKTLKQAVAHLNRYDSNKAFETLNQSGLIKETDAAIDDIKKEFFNFDDKKNTQAIVAGKESFKDKIILTNTNKMKEEINLAIRDELKSKGEIEKKDFKFTVRESARLMPSEVYLSENYKRGNLVFIQKDIDDTIKAGKEFKIIDVNNEKNSITIENSEGAFKQILSLDRYGNHLQQYEEKEKSFSVGEKIVFEKNDKQLGVSNGESAIIKSIDKNGNITVDKEGNNLEFNITKYGYINHGYAITTHKSQGQTAKNVVAYMDSKAQNFNSFYVAVTRAENNIKIFTDNKEDLKKFVEIEQEKLNAVQAVEKLASKEEEWGVNQANKTPATQKQLKTANNIAKALNLDFKDTSKYATAEFIEQHINDYRKYLMQQPASDKQIDFANKIANTLGLEFNGSTREETKSFIEQYSKDFTEFINDRVGYLTKIDPSSLDQQQKDKYYKDYYHEISKGIAKQDIETIDKLYEHLEKIDDFTTENKTLKLEAYEKAFRVKNSEVVKQLSGKYFDYDPFLRDFYANNPLELSNELKNAGLDYKFEKELAKVDLITERYNQHSYDRMANAKSENEFNEILERQEQFEDFTRQYKEELTKEYDYDKLTSEIDEHLSSGEVFEAAKMIEENKYVLEEKDLEQIQTKLENVFDQAMEKEASKIEKQIEEEKDFLVSEIEEYFEAKEERLEAEETEAKEFVENLEQEQNTQNTQEEEKTDENENNNERGDDGYER